MSKAALDSDLYGDIYGDDDNEFAVPLQYTDEDTSEDPTNDKKDPIETTPAPSDDSRPPKPPPTNAQDVHRSLPAKPLSPNSASLSYSAQIAQQFSAYQQTPSQERQQRAEIPLPQNPRPSAKAGPSAIATHEGSPNPGSTDSIFGKKPSEMHDAGKMFIGGLNWDTTDEGLRNYFSEFGKVDACTIMRDPAGTSRGFAFLTFEDPNSVNAVVVREHYLDGKAIDPKRAIPREEHLRNTRYFVGGLSPTTTSESMREFFATYGKVVDATVMVDRESARSKGFGFVTFEDATNADQLVGKIGLVMDDKQIEVKMAQPRSQRDQSRNPTGNPPTNNREPFFNDQESRTPSTNIPFPLQQQNPMSMLYQRQMPMMGAGMPMMNMNPMAMAMGMGMNGYNAMGGMNGMNMMGMNMNGMANMNGMGNMGAMRLGMGPMGSGVGPGGMAGPVNSAGMGMGMGMRPVLNGMGGMLGSNFGRMAMNGGGTGPARLNSRGQHNFHPYAR